MLRGRFFDRGCLWPKRPLELDIDIEKIKMNKKEEVKDEEGEQENKGNKEISKKEDGEQEEEGEAR